MNATLELAPTEARTAAALRVRDAIEQLVELALGDLAAGNPGKVAGLVAAVGRGEFTLAVDVLVPVTTIVLVANGPAGVVELLRVEVPDRPTAAAVN